LLLGLTASHFSKRGAMVGLEFWQRFRRPVFADETIRIEWLVVRVTPNQRLGGEIVELRLITSEILTAGGRISNRTGKNHENNPTGTDQTNDHR
jgi:acyl dehydratase